MGKVTKELALPVYQVLAKENLVAWEDEFAEYLEEYRRSQDVEALIASLEQLFQTYRIDLREKRKPKVLKPSDLEVVCYMFLTGSDLKGITLET